MKKSNCSTSCLWGEYAQMAKGNLSRSVDAFAGMVEPLLKWVADISGTDGAKLLQNMVRARRRKQDNRG